MTSLMSAFNLIEKIENNNLNQRHQTNGRLWILKGIHKDNPAHTSYQDYKGESAPSQDCHNHLLEAPAPATPDCQCRLLPPLLLRRPAKWDRGARGEAFKFSYYCDLGVRTGDFIRRIISGLAQRPAIVEGRNTFLRYNWSESQSSEVDCYHLAAVGRAASNYNHINKSKHFKYFIRTLFWTKFSVRQRE